VKCRSDAILEISTASNPAMTEYTLHTSSLFDPKLKRVRKNVSITVDSSTGLIVRVFERDDDLIRGGDVDLRGKYVMPGLVDAHTHVFLHSYE
jgi:imidazolonepropionase-like amidohydrolase